MAKAGLVVLGIGAAVAGGIILLTRGKGVKLHQGWNEYLYTGPARRAGDLFSSIENYLIIVYYFWEETGQWVGVTEDLWVQPDYFLNINVSQDCTWAF